MIGSTTGFSRGWPATSVLRLTAERPVERRPEMERRGAEVVLVAVQNPPRIGEVRPISSLVSQVLERYGLSQQAGEERLHEGTTEFDVWA